MNLMERNHREEEPDWREDIRSERMEEGEEQEDDLRVEDLDPVRCQPAYAWQLMEDLEWLGLDWDEGGSWNFMRITLAGTPSSGRYVDRSGHLL